MQQMQGHEKLSGFVMLLALAAGSALAQDTPPQSAQPDAGEWQLMHDVPEKPQDASGGRPHTH